MNYDVLILGDEQEGIDRAISAAREGRHVGLVQTSGLVSSLELMRRAATQITEKRQVTMVAWREAVLTLAQSQLTANRKEVERLGVDWICGQPSFVSPESVEVSDGNRKRLVSGNEIIVACGTKSWQPESLRGDDRFVMNLENLLNLDCFPRSMVVVGAGATGLSSAMMLATLGIDVTVVDERVSPLEMIGAWGCSADAVQTLNIAFRFGEEVIGTDLRADGKTAVRLACGRIIVAEAVLICTGREGNTQNLNLEIAGVGLDERGRVWSDARGQTWNPRISAVGDVVGFRQVARHSSEIAPVVERENVRPRQAVLTC